jgi:hypothetical protein
MIEKLITYLQGKGWHYIENKEQGLISFSLAGTNGTFQCIAKLEEKEQKFGFYSYCLANCPAESILKMAELLMRLNKTVFYGSFELNFETGVILFKTSLFAETIDLTPAVLDNIVISNVFVMDDYTPIILKLIYGNLAPLEAYELRFGQQHQLEK